MEVDSVLPANPAAPSCADGSSVPRHQLKRQVRGGMRFIALATSTCLWVPKVSRRATVTAPGVPVRHDTDLFPCRTR